MSVINTMLKDLDRRGVEYTNSDDAILSGLEASGSDEDNNRTSSPYLTSAASVLIVGAVLVIGYLVSPYQLVAMGNERSLAAAVKTNEQPAPEPVITAQAEVITVAPEVETEPAPEIEPNTQASASTQSVAELETLAATESEPALQEAKKPQAVAAVVKPQPTKKKQVAARKKSTPVVADEQIHRKQREFSAEEKSQQAYAQALTFYNEGGRQSAKASLQDALEHNPGHKEARALLAAIHLEDGKPEIATEVIAKGLSLDANDQQMLRLYLQAQVQSGDYTEAIAVMEQRLRLSRPEDFGYLAGLYQKNNDHLNAVKMYARALQLKPSNSIWWMGQGISFEMMEQYDEAIQSYQQSISTGRLSGKLADYATTRINTIKQLNDDSVS